MKHRVRPLECDVRGRRVGGRATLKLIAKGSYTGVILVAIGSRDRHKIQISLSLSLSLYPKGRVIRRRARRPTMATMTKSTKTKTTKNFGHFAPQQQADVLHLMCPRPFVGPDGLELVSYPRYRPIKKPAAYRPPIGRVRPP